ncbi:hypothetical protein HAX54_004321, partial [Datura stramonium]|nr:hypothetical protein [Datura stramonium]
NLVRVPQWRQDSNSLEVRWRFAEYAVGGTQGHKFMDCPVRESSGTTRPTRSVAGSYAPAGLSGPGAQLGQGPGRGEAATLDYSYPHPRVFALDSQRVTEPPAGNMSGIYGIIGIFLSDPLFYKLVG